MQKLCRRDGNGICINCDNPDNLLCRKDVEWIVDILREIVNDYVLRDTSLKEVMRYESIDKDDWNKIMGMKSK